MGIDVQTPISCDFIDKQIFSQTMVTKLGYTTIFVDVIDAFLYLFPQNHMNKVFY
jgi:hypothetical protein